MNGNGKAPHKVRSASNGLGVAQQNVGTTAQNVGTTLHGAGTTAHGAGMTAQDVRTAAHDAGVTPQGAGTAAHSAGATPQGAGTTAHGAGVTPQGAGVTPQGVGTTAHGAGVTPQGAGTAAQPASRSTRRHRREFSRNASIAQRLATAQVMIDTILGAPDLQALRAEQGYDSTRMQQGRVLCERALALAQRQRTHYGDLYAATDARGTARAQAHATYLRHCKLAKIALRDNRGAIEKLGLIAQRAATLAGWLLQAQQFYTNALADVAITSALAEYAVTREQLEVGRQQIVAVMVRAVTQQTQKITAQATTQARDIALDALNRWMRDFLVVVHMALADYPLRLAQLGLGAAA